MNKKNIILDLSCELIERVDRLNKTGDRSDFISKIIQQQQKHTITGGIDETTEFFTKMSNKKDIVELSGEINLIDDKGMSLGKYDINTLEGFEELIKMIKEISKDPAVQIRARSMF